MSRRRDPRFPLSLGGAAPGTGFYQGPVASTRMANSRANVLYGNAISPHLFVESGNRLKIVLPNWYSNLALGDSDGYGSVTYSAAIDYLGVKTSFLFGGSTTGTVANGFELESDWLSVNYTAGGAFTIRVWFNAAVGFVYYAMPTNSGNIDSVLGAKFEFQNGVLTDKTLGGTITTSNPLAMFAPLAIIGDTKRPTILAVGDSILAGQSDTFDGTVSQLGYVERAMASTYAMINCGVPGQLASDFNTGTPSTRRQALKKWTSHSLCEYGVNDVNVASQATVQASLSTLAGKFSDKIHLQAVLMPRCTSTDSFTTTALETTVTNFGVGERLDLVNASIKNGTVTGLSGGYLDIAKLMFDASNKWLTDGVTPNKYTADGIHPVAFATKVAAAGFVPASIHRP